MKHTERLLLRRPVPTDVDRLHDIYGDPRTNLYNPFGPHPDRSASAAVLAGWIDHWDRHGFGQWAIATRDTPDHVIGFGGIAYRKYLDEDALNLGYRFDVESWGRGYATELGRAALDHAFSALNQPQVFAIVRPANLSSIRVLEKLGMRRVGLFDDVPGDVPSFMYRSDAPVVAGSDVIAHPLDAMGSETNRMPTAPLPRANPALGDSDARAGRESPGDLE